MMHEEIDLRDPRRKETRRESWAALGEVRKGPQDRPKSRFVVETPVVTRKDKPFGDFYRGNRTRSGRATPRTSPTSASTPACWPSDDAAAKNACSACDFGIGIEHGSPRWNGVVAVLGDERAIRRSRRRRWKLSIRVGQGSGGAFWITNGSMKFRLKKPGLCAGFFCCMLLLGRRMGASEAIPIINNRQRRMASRAPS